MSGINDWLARHGFDRREFYRRGLRYDDVKHLDEEVVRRSAARAKARVAADGG